LSFPLILTSGSGKMSEMKDEKKLIVIVPFELHREVKTLSAITDESMRSIVIKALTSYLKRNMEVGTYPRLEKLPEKVLKHARKQIKYFNSLK